MLLCHCNCLCHSLRHKSRRFCLKMEARRLAILCSHLRPLDSRPVSVRPLPVSTSDCASTSNHQHHSNRQNDCVFCKIIGGELPAFKLYEDDMCLCILDKNPLSRGHSLIIPKSHFSSLQETPPSVVAAMCSKVPFISSAIMKATGSDSFNLLVNNGEAAGQVIFHTHIHIIPRKASDCLWASESLRRHSLKQDQEASRLVDCVREQLLSDNSEDIKGEGSSLIRNQ
ncbi:adenylylsulfatase HINT3 isoform X2 [Ziziphus jujuba]|uniref:Adenylylsulfatase HINT3 isoform X2 n=1 Tax=Ziziphus jujuba TaxID=326968 RepID=A0A6P4ASU1_ZIZJJ|nr:adenylylsulfatase HINT3 isoform X2 [Ziziphus jujuba]